ncbi:MAG TPA: hypothetical protein VF541_16290, partial [Longimicrobium sp.]
MLRVVFILLGRFARFLAIELFPALPSVVAGTWLLRRVRHVAAGVALPAPLRTGRMTREIGRVIPEAAFAAVLLFAASVPGSPWGSAFAAWLGLGLAAVSLAALGPYARLLWRLRRDPGSLRAEVVCGATAGGLFGGERGVDPEDARRWLRGDLRRVDRLGDAEAARALGLAPGEVALVPHFPLAAPHEDPRDIAPLRRAVLQIGLSSVGAGTMLNRRLNAALPDELWEVSRDLCRLQPRGVALAWKRFHAHDTLAG